MTPEWARPRDAPSAECQRKARVGGLHLRVICQRFALFVSGFFPAVTNPLSAHGVGGWVGG